MEFIRTIRQKCQTRRENDIQRQAEELITVADFIDNLYIAYNGFPLFPVEATWTQKEIIEELTKVRNNYINSRKKGQTWNS